MDRSAMKALYQRGMSKAAIARQLGCNRRTVHKALEESPDITYQREQPGSSVEQFKDDIFRWLDQGVPVSRMLEMAREDPEHPYRGGKSVFYERVKTFREQWKQSGQEAWIRFEGMPAEYLQIDWGESRNFPFLAQEKTTRYFFCARLKYSRYSYVEFTTDMRQETFIRCIIRAFEYIGGVPWVCIFDNLKTAVNGRDEQGKPIWNSTFLKFAVEMEFHPEACHPYSGNQKGTVENLVKWVKSNFLPGREFLNDADLATQCRQWLESKNNSLSQAHGKIPHDLLAVEREKFTPLKDSASSYGIFQQVVVGPESLASVDGARYSVPVGYVGRTLTVRIREQRIDFYDGQTQVASHQRMDAGRKPVIVPEHFEPVLVKKPRGRVMVYRDYLMAQDSSIEAYIAELCYRWKGTFDPHILKMYELLQRHGADNLGCACALASEHGAYGADYLEALLRRPRKIPALCPLTVEGVPVQEDIDRTLSLYESFVRGVDTGD